MDSEILLMILKGRFEELFILFLAAFAFVFFKAFQQLNVMHHSLKWVVPTSFLMATCEVTLIVGAVTQGVAAIVPYGLGGGLGCLASMVIHKRMRR